MGRKIIKALIVGPYLTSEIVGPDASHELAKSVLDLANTAGVTIFLTAITERDVSALKSWFSGDLGEQLKSNIRVLTPGRFLWSHGEIRMPFETKRPQDALQTAAPLIAEVLRDAEISARVSYNADDESILLVGPETLSAEVRKEIVLAANTPEFAFGINPDADLEAEQQADGNWIAVLGPDRASEVWHDAATYIELFPPEEVAVLETAGKIGAVLTALDKKLRADRRLGVDLTERSADVEPEAEAGVWTAIPVSVAFAARIAAPSEIHFIQRWSQTNREYVRRSYWHATKTSEKNQTRGKELLRSLDPARYRRAKTLADLSDASQGAQLVDDFSGAICFAPGFYEFEAPRPTGLPAVDVMVAELLMYFDEKLEEMPFDRPLLRRRLFSNSLVLLRGEGYYANLKQTPPWARAADYVTEARALAELCRKLLLGGPADMDRAFQACLADDQATATAWKLLLAVMDQARNLGLIMLSVSMHLWRGSQKTWSERNLIRRATELVSLHYAVMLGDGALNGSEVLRTVRDAADTAAAELNYLQTTEMENARTSDWYEPGKPIRGWREADNPFENLLLGLLAADSLPPTDLPAAALGLFWGGVELPISTKAAATALGRSIDAFGFISVGHYSGAAAPEEGFYCDLSTGDFSDFKDLLRKQPSRVLLLDDNALSGRTLETARDLLMSYGATAIDTWVVRFSGERREGQMRMADSGIVHPSYSSRNLKGTLGETPYARSYSRKHYESPVGVFNVARARVLRYLHSNGFASIFEREGF